MKIDQNLRAAIRSFCSISKRVDTYESRRSREEIAINDLLNGTPAGRKWLKNLPIHFKAVDALKARIEKLTEQNDSLPSELGIDVNYNRKLDVRDHEAFAKAGGKIDVKTSRSPDQIIAQLAAATPEAGAKILSDLGIKWE